jgi:hypothetical protein
MTRSTTDDAAPDHADLESLKAYKAEVERFEALETRKAEAETELLILALLAFNNLVQRGWESEARKLLAAPEGTDPTALAEHIAVLGIAAQVKLCELADVIAGRGLERRPERELQELLATPERATRKRLTARVAELEAERTARYDAAVSAANSAIENAAVTRAQLGAERAAAREARDAAYDESRALRAELLEARSKGEMWRNFTFMLAAMVAMLLLFPFL